MTREESLIVGLQVLDTFEGMTVSAENNQINVGIGYVPPMPGATRYFLTDVLGWRYTDDRAAEWSFDL